LVGAFEVNEPVVSEIQPNRRRLTPKILVATLILFAGIFLANTWLNSQWYVGTESGNVAIFQGIDQQIGPISFSKLNTRTELPTSALSPNDLAAIENGVSTQDLSAGLVIVQDIWSRSSICESAVAGCTP